MPACRRLVLLLLVGLAACRAAPSAGPAGGGTQQARSEVGAVLDALHDAAARADEATYFGLFAPGAVFLGTDPTERWTLQEFRTWAHPHFASGRGWTYRVEERHVELAEGLGTAWFDERLSNAAYGECRGTGVLTRAGTTWRIAQYSLSLPVPNDLARDLVERIRAAAGG